MYVAVVVMGAALAWLLRGRDDGGCEDGEGCSEHETDMADGSDGE